MVTRASEPGAGVADQADLRRRVVIACDKFKGCLTATEVGQALAAGLLDRLPDLEVIQAPVADGGDGTVAAALGAGYRWQSVITVGPTGLPVQTGYAVDGDRAVVELADVVGLGRLPQGQLDPLGASTFGLGVVVRDAIERGAVEIVLGLGGSASTDGGAGLVQALGAVLTDDGGADLAPGGGPLAAVQDVDVRQLRERIEGVRFVVACDVDNPLLGPRGSAAVFGPQKGADPTQVRQLEAALTRWSAAVGRATGVNSADLPGAGAAGGAGFAALALLDAELRPGIELVLDLIDFRRRLTGASLVITGEGSLDEQSLSGKAPIGVARVCAERQPPVPVVAAAGRNTLSPERLVGAGITRAYPLADLEPDLATSLAQAAQLLRRVGATIAEEWLSGPPAPAQPGSSRSV